MDTPIKHLGSVIIAIIAVLLCVTLVRGIVTKTGEKINSSMDELSGISVSETVVPEDE